MKSETLCEPVMYSVICSRQDIVSFVNVVYIIYNSKKKRELDEVRLRGWPHAADREI